MNINNILDRFAAATFLYICRALFIFFIGIYLANILGVNQFGIYSYLLAISISIWTFLDLGLQKAFYVFISSKLQGKNFYNFYLVIVIIQLLIGVLVSKLLQDSLFISDSKTIDRNIFLYAFLAIFSQKALLNQSTLISESYRFTKWGNSIEVGSYALQLIVFISSLAGYFDLNLPNIFLLIFFSNTFFSILSLAFIFKHGFGSDENFIKERSDLIVYFKPFIPFIMLGALIQFYDFWLLNYYSGNSEQAFYQIANRFSLIAILVSSALINILGKEIAEANHLGNEKAWLGLSFNSIKTMFFFSSFVTMYLVFFAENIINLFLSDEYLDGLNTFRVVCLYTPIHIVSTLISTSFYSIKKGHVWISIQMKALLLSIPITYALVSTGPNFFNFDLGSLGLAIKLLLVNLVSSQIGYFIFFRKYSLRKKISFQLKSIIIFSLIAFLSKFFTTLFIGINEILILTLGLILYMVLAFGMNYFAPNILGLNKNIFKIS